MKNETNTTALSTTQESIESLTKLTDRANEYISKSRSENTKKAYESDFRHFSDWANDLNLDFFPAIPQTIVCYLTHLSESCSVATISRKMAAISQAHKLSGLSSPTKDPLVREVLTGIKRELGSAQTKAKPIDYKLLCEMVDHCSWDMIGRRDRVILLLGWSAALRRSEIVAVNSEDIEFVKDGLILTKNRSKTDQEGSGHRIGIPRNGNIHFCPVRAVENWLALTNIKKGPIFTRLGSGHRNNWVLQQNNEQKRLSNKSISLIIKKILKASDVDPKGYSGHSLRSGFITEAARRAVPEIYLSKHTGHKSINTMRGYVQEANLFELNPLRSIFDPSPPSKSDIPPNLTR